jgi:hypothetical protein
LFRTVKVVAQAEREGAQIPRATATSNQPRPFVRVADLAHWIDDDERFMETSRVRSFRGGHACRRHGVMPPGEPPPEDCTEGVAEESRSLAADIRLDGAGVCAHE